MTIDECARVSRIWAEQALGASSSAADQEFVEQHLAHCSKCRVEARLVDALRIAPGANPAPALNDFERRRFMEECLRKHRETVSAKKRGAMAGRRAFWAAAAAVALLSLGGLWLWARKVAPEPEGQSPVASTRVMSGLQETQAQVVLTSGGQIYKNDLAMARGGSFGPTETMSTGQGNAVVLLAQGVKAHLSDHTAIRAVRHPSFAVEIDLLRGSILVEAKPDKVSGALRVSTRAGEVLVKGTVFSVSDEHSQVLVGVLRGSVEVTQGDSAPVAVNAGGRYALTASKMDALSVPEVTGLRSRLEMIGLTDCGSCSPVEIETVPPGATVTLDDREMGVTPIAAEIGEGAYSLSVHLPGYDSIRETVWVESGRLLKRSFFLVDKNRLFQDELSAQGFAHASPTPSLRSSESSQEKDQEENGAAALLRQARAARKQRDWQGAAELYEQIIAQYPESFEAHSSWVSLGYLQLDYLGRAAQSLMFFEEYLRRQKEGSLVQEAAYGRILALRTLGDTRREAAALQEFAVRFPTAIQTGAAKARLAELDAELLGQE
jgi:hypothetical protein